MNFFKSKKKHGYSALAVANAFILVARRAGKRLTSLHLQRLVYISQGIALASLGRPMYHNDTQAWFYGPAIPELRFALRNYGKSSVVAHLIPAADEMFKDSERMEIVQNVFIALGEKSDRQLAGLTHRDDTPWAISKRRHQRVIPLDLIREKFTEWFVEPETQVSETSAPVPAQPAAAPAPQLAR